MNQLFSRSKTNACQLNLRILYVQVYHDSVSAKKRDHLIISSCLGCPTLPFVPASPVPVAAFSLLILSQISELETATPSF